MIDKINRYYLNHILENGTDETDFEFIVFTNLMDYIRNGAYSTRRNKSLILKYWTEYNNNELAALLGISTSSISYAKKDICNDLKNALGLSIVTLIENKNFEKINEILMIEFDYSNQETLLPHCFIKNIDKAYQQVKIKQVDCKQAEHLASKQLHKDLFDKNSPRSEDLDNLLHFIQRNYFPRTEKMIGYFDIYKLKEVTDILLGIRGTAEIRHELISILTESSSRFEKELNIKNMEKIMNEMADLDLFH